MCTYPYGMCTRRTRAILLFNSRNTQSMKYGDAKEKVDVPDIPEINPRERP